MVNRVDVRVTTGDDDGPMNGIMGAHGCGAKVADVVVLDRASAATTCAGPPRRRNRQAATARPGADSRAASGASAPRRRRCRYRWIAGELAVALGPWAGASRPVPPAACSRARATRRGPWAPASPRPAKGVGRGRGPPAGSGEPPAPAACRLSRTDNRDGIEAVVGAAGRARRRPRAAGRWRVRQTQARARAADRVDAP